MRLPTSVFTNACSRSREAPVSCEVLSMSACQRAMRLVSESSSAASVRTQFRSIVWRQRIATSWRSLSTVPSRWVAASDCSSRHTPMAALAATINRITPNASPSLAPMRSLRRPLMVGTPGAQCGARGKKQVCAWNSCGSEDGSA